MSLNYDTSKQVNGNALYRGRKFFGGLVIHLNDVFVCYNAEAILAVLKEYEDLLISHQYQKARENERQNKRPITWLNGIIADLIAERKDLAKRLVEEFQDRGFSQSWLE